MSTTAEPLPAEALRRIFDPAGLPFETTAELEPLAGAIGQARAAGALEFGTGIRHAGYGMFVLGPPGSGRHTMVREHLERIAQAQPTPSDWCYVNDFQKPHCPLALRLPPGKGDELREDMQRLVDELRAALPATFESDDYRTRMEAINAEFKERHEQAFDGLNQRAREKGITIVRTVSGLALAPVEEDGQVVDPAEFAKLPDEQKERIQSDISALQSELQGVLRQVPKWNHEQREKVRELNRQITEFAVGHLIDALRERYHDLPAVLGYFAAVQQDIVAHADQFVPAGADGNPLEAMLAMSGAVRTDGDKFRRYQVNVIVDHGHSNGAPVVYEDQANHHDLFGRIEHVSQLGALLTDFTLIKPGALHRANGGYLILDARQTLSQPFVWEDLKRALRSRQIRVQSLAEKLSLVSTISLDPEPIPLDVKVVLIGERVIYYLLCALDPEFEEHFKVPVDFDDRAPWDDETGTLYARAIATLCGKESLRALDRGATARVIEHAARLCGDREKLSAQIAKLFDLVREADFWAGQGGRSQVTDADVDRAIDAQVHRADRVRERAYEHIRRGTVTIDTRGARGGQVNGLSVVQLGGFAFGQPNRITARVRLGKGEVVDIEREVELGGPIHSKGVLILAGFVGERYAGDRPLCLSASIVFEQSYAGVEGDSASSAELYALLSALASLPLRQSLAVTGSVDQHGRVQAIGGVNEKIEGFFDVCRADGLSGEQGVLIPAANVQHLMLRRDVVEAAAEGRFHVFPIETIDQGIELLCGAPAGERGPDGRFPAGSVNRRVDDRLGELCQKARAFAGGRGEQQAGPA